jgi:hypothetical protein
LSPEARAEQVDKYRGSWLSDGIAIGNSAEEARTTADLMRRSDIHNTNTRLKAFCHDTSLHIIWPTPVSAPRLDNFVAPHKSIFCHANLQMKLETFSHTRQA